MTCGEYTPEFTDFDCHCYLKREGHPPAQVWWAGQDERSDVLTLPHVRREQDGTNYTCLMSWTGPDGTIVTDSTVYTLRVAYGPSDNDTFIEGPGKAVVTSGLKIVPLICVSSEVSPPDPLVRWTLPHDYTCQGGNQRPQCKFRPDPILGQMLSVTCKLTNRMNPTFHGKATFTIRLVWQDGAVISVFQFDRMKGRHLQTQNPDAPLTLRCVAIANPTPVLDVYKLANTYSTSALRGQKLTAGQQPRSPFKRTKVYTVRSPKCGRTDTYRCDASNRDIRTSKFVTLSSNCTALLQKKTRLSTVAILGIIGAIIATVIFLICLLILLAGRRKEARPPGVTDSQTPGSWEDWEREMEMAGDDWRRRTRAQITSQTSTSGLFTIGSSTSKSSSSESSTSLSETRNQADVSGQKSREGNGQGKGKGDEVRNHSRPENVKESASGSET